MQTLPQTLRIGVLRGGPSPEYEVSLKSGANVLSILSETHKPYDIFISKDGTWHINGIERSPDRILKHIDVVFNALHGIYGEDGGVQEILDYHGIPYTGSDKFSSALAMNKYLTKERAAKVGIKTPSYTIVRDNENLSEKAGEIFETLPHPVIIKPTSSGSSLGILITQTPKELLDGLMKTLSEHKSALVEEYIPGREATCGVLSNFRGQDIYALPPIEIVPPEGKWFDYDAKYSGESKEICPGNFTTTEKKEIERISTLIHQTLGLSHYSRSDFIVSPKRGIFFLEVNTLPGLTSESLIPKALTAVGVSVKEFLHHTLSLALGKK